MCIICVDYQKQILTANEALNNLSEMASSIDTAHFDKVNKMLLEAIKEEEIDKELVEWLLKHDDLSELS